MCVRVVSVCVVLCESEKKILVTLLIKASKVTPSFLVCKARADTTQSSKLYFDH
jgi:hypothetical protein